MSLTENIEGLAQAMTAAKRRVAAIDDQLQTLDMERTRLQSAKPHTDDIIATHMRALDASCRSFETQLGVALEAPPTNGRNPTVALLTDGPAIAYFLRDRIKAELPQLVERLIPSAKVRKTRQELAAASAALDAERGSLVEERQKLCEEIDAVRRVAIP